jgi:hypothetical protein
VSRLIKLRVGVLGLLAMLLLGSYAATPAFAEGGPYCHERALGGSGEGEKIEANAPEQFKTKGGEQKFAGKVAGTKIEVAARSVQIKGIVYNNADQCQAKAELALQQLKVAGFPACVATINSNNIIKLYGHRAWKYSGNTSELTEKPEGKQKLVWIFAPVELQPGATGLQTKALFSTIKFSGAECIFTGVKVEVNGTVGAESAPSNTGEWGTKEEQIYTNGEVWLHFWNGKEFIPVKTALTLNGAPATYTGILNLETVGRQGGPPREIGYFEK